MFWISCAILTFIGTKLTVLSTNTLIIIEIIDTFMWNFNNYWHFFGFVLNNLQWFLKNVFLEEFESSLKIGNDISRYFGLSLSRWWMAKKQLQFQNPKPCKNENNENLFRHFWQCLKFFSIFRCQPSSLYHSFLLQGLLRLFFHSLSRKKSEQVGRRAP